MGHWQQILLKQEAAGPVGFQPEKPTMTGRASFVWSTPSYSVHAGTLPPGEQGGEREGSDLRKCQEVATQPRNWVTTCLLFLSLGVRRETSRQMKPGPPFRALGSHPDAQAIIHPP